MSLECLEEGNDISADSHVRLHRGVDTSTEWRFLRSRTCYAEPSLSYGNIRVDDELQGTCNNKHQHISLLHPDLFAVLPPAMLAHQHVVIKLGHADFYKPKKRSSAN